VGWLRRDYKPLTDSEKVELKKKYVENKLRKIPPGDSVEYFDNFWTASDVNRQGEKYKSKSPYFERN